MTNEPIDEALFVCHDRRLDAAEDRLMNIEYAFRRLCSVLGLPDDETNEVMTQAKRDRDAFIALEEAFDNSPSLVDDPLN